MNPGVYELAKSGNYAELLALRNEDDLFHQRTPKKNNILHVAVQYENARFIGDLRECPFGPFLLWEGNYKGDTPLHLAAKVGNLQTVEVFIKLAKSLDWVVEYGQIDAWKELLRKLNSDRDTALHYALKRRHLAVVNLLVETDPDLCDITNAADESPLYLAADQKLSFATMPILAAFPSAYKGPKGLTALHAAVYCSMYGLADILEKRPDLISEGDDIGWTPLHYVASKGKVKEVELLLQHNPSVVYELDREGQSALHIAAFRGYLHVIDKIVRSYPDACDIINTKGQTALHAAVIGGQVSAVKYMLGMPNSEDLINEQDTDGNTALHLATLHKQYNTIYILARDKRVDSWATNKDHLTALDIFITYKEVGYRAAKVRHVLQGSSGILGYQGWVIEKIKKKLDKKSVEDLPAVSITTRSNTTDRENNKSSKSSIIQLQVAVATLIATATFTAAFTMPGGYSSDKANRGLATLAGRAAFEAFVISNTTAFSLSLLALFLQFDTSGLSERQQVRYTNTAAKCIYIAILGMVLAFGSGSYVVLTDTIGLGIIPYVVSGCLTIVYLSGAFLDPESLHWPKNSTRRKYIRSLLFDYGIL